MTEQIPIPDDPDLPVSATMRGDYIIRMYLGSGWGEKGQPAQNAGDILADLLRTLPEEDWGAILRMGVMHAYDERHGWGSAKGIDVFIEGLQEAA